ncbi:hypothetical protein THAOC_32815 [Thalassiosira oceanica]|uniref:RING-type domain-containing protein n=1 Tax=Thalassiosira oceanica TaxID=159749 RepID=K0RHG2_THAOC|nr:hypothetical protein THAOC_32815 [Thalassiosira oceanica]|eukprot:EJK48391.1 hypothetical protein THAOC_32815 [Thalassiosira oceanica]
MATGGPQILTGLLLGHVLPVLPVLCPAGLAQSQSSHIRLPSASHNPSSETARETEAPATPASRGTGEGRRTRTGEDKKREATASSMFVFGSAAKADADGDDGGRGKASSTTDEAPSFAFDASFLPAVTATPTANDDDEPIAGGRFKFNVPPSQAATEGGVTGDSTPLFGSTLKSRQEVGAGVKTVKTQTKREEATDGGSGEQGAPVAMHSSVASAANPLPDVVTEEELINSGHELPVGYTCPLCCLPIALPVGKHSMFKSCCMKMVCHGCIHASAKRGMGNMCPFCRTPTPDSDAAILAQVRKRVEAKDPKAIEFLARTYYNGKYGLKQETSRAIELWTESAILGDLDAHYRLGVRYYKGKDVEQDVARGIRHWQYAAIQGHPESRCSLGLHECVEGNYELTVQHLMISAKMGYQDSLNGFKLMFKKGHATKAQYAEALKGYQDALEETKSHQREEAKAFFNGTPPANTPIQDFRNSFSRVHQPLDRTVVLPTRGVLRGRNGAAPRALEFLHSAPVAIRLRCSNLGRALAPRELEHDYGNVSAYVKSPHELLVRVPNVDPKIEVFAAGGVGKARPGPPAVDGSLHPRGGAMPRRVFISPHPSRKTEWGAATGECHISTSGGEAGKRGEVAPRSEAPVGSSSPRRHRTSSRRAPKDDANGGRGSGTTRGRAYGIVGEVPLGRVPSPTSCPDVPLQNAALLSTLPSLPASRRCTPSSSVHLGRQRGGLPPSVGAAVCGTLSPSIAGRAPARQPRTPPPNNHTVDAAPRGEGLGALVSTLPPEAADSSASPRPTATSRLGSDGPPPGRGASTSASPCPTAKLQASTANPPPGDKLPSIRVRARKAARPRLGRLGHALATRGTGAVGPRGVGTRQTRNPLASSLPTSSGCGVGRLLYHAARQCSGVGRHEKTGARTEARSQRPKTGAKRTPIVPLLQPRQRQTLERTRREKQIQSMFVFGSAAKADADGDEGGRGKASSTTATDGAPSFAFDASFLPAVTATPTANDDDKPVEGGFKFNVPPSQAATARGEAGDTSPLFGSTFKSRQEVGAGVKAQTKYEEATGEISGEQGAPIAMHCSVASAGFLLREPVTQEELMNSGHELPERYTCPLCCLPIALPAPKHSKVKPCCMKTVCNGCIHASRLRGMEKICAFCRTPTPKRGAAATLALVRKRVDARDPKATEILAYAYCHGKHGLQQDIPRAIELWTEAARLAIQGHPDSRHMLGFLEYNNGNHELAVQHWMISAKLGCEQSLNVIKKMVMEGDATKAHYAEALGGYQNALKETKSPQREEAKAFFSRSG